MTDSKLEERLRTLPDLTVATSDAERSAAARDFGRLTEGKARAIARPASEQALVELVRLARVEGFELTPRALGLSQSGQSVPRDGVTVDLSALGGVEVDADRRLGTCGPAVTWRQLLAASAPHGLAPAVVPFNLDLSIGGTLSAGGLGSTSHQYGFAASTVDALRVVTGAGEAFETTPTERRDIYDVVLGGVGRFGFMTRVSIRLRKMLPRTRTFHLLYDDFESMLADQGDLMARGHCTHLEGFAAAAVQGVRVGPQGRRIPFARWFPGLQVSVEYELGAEPQRASYVEHVRARELVHVDDSESPEFAARYDSRLEMMRATGAWDQPHPWLECTLPFDAAVRVLPKLVPEIPLFLGDGHRMMPIADVDGPTFLMRPRGQPGIGVAILPISVPPAFHAPAMAALKGVHERFIEAGGKRYLSGWLFEPDDAAWKRHYGDGFEVWCARKRELDPDGVLASSLIGTA